MKARKLNGDFTVVVFSASSPVAATVPTRYHRGKEYLISKRIRVVDGSLMGKQDFYRSGGIRKRADELISSCQVELDATHQRVMLLESPLS